MAGTIALPNSSAPVQLDTGLVNTVWYRFFQELARAIATSGGGGGVSEVVAGPGLAGGTITSSGTISLTLDYFGNAPGDLLVRGASAWQALSPGGPGEVLTIGSAGNNPSWAEPSTTVPPGAELLGSNSGGTIVAVGIDATLQEVSGMLGLGQAPAKTLLANPAGMAAQPSATTLTSFLDSIFGTATGELLYRAPAGWQSLSIGSLGQVLTVSPSGVPQWQNGGVIVYPPVTSLGATVTSLSSVVLDG